MIKKHGNLLRMALDDHVDEFTLTHSAPQLRAAVVDRRLPVVLQLGELRPDANERWSRFKDRVVNELGGTAERIRHEFHAEVRLLVAGNAVETALDADQLDALQSDPGIEIRFAELNPLVEVATMDDVPNEIGLAPFQNGGPFDGTGVKVAVLDSGVDAAHPALSVADQVETVGESVDIPGSHGTHVAGIIASDDVVFRGVATGVELVDVKVLRANGTGQHTSITAGVDEALDRECDILNMSLGFNHIPTAIPGGHEWTCDDGLCPLCLAVDNAVAEGALVVVAAGNEHQRAQQARFSGMGLDYDTELGCPGQARAALTVANLVKVSSAPAWTSSNGPTAYGMAKPDLGAPGTDILSTIPLPRLATGAADLSAPRSFQFAAKSGTSMASPVVAGACALLIERARRDGLPDDPKSIRDALLDGHVEAIGGPRNVVGGGRLRLS